jgi:hypothetical protein
VGPNYSYAKNYELTDMDSLTQIIEKLTRWDTFRIGLSVPFFIYSILAILKAYSIQDISLLFALTGTAIGSLGFGFSLLSSVLTGIQIRELKQLLEKRDF